MARGHGITRLSTGGPWHEVLRGTARARLEAALPAWLVAQRWFGGKARQLAAVRLVDDAPVADGPDAPRIALLRVEYAAGAPEQYALPLAFAAADEGAPDGDALARIVASGRAGLLRAADGDPSLARALLDAIARGRRLAGSAGEVVAWSTGALGRAAIDPADPALEPALLGAEQSNTSIRFGRRLVLKLFRRTEPGQNPEIEVGAYLTDVSPFAFTAPVLGGLEYRPRDGEPFALGVLQEFVANEGDAWRFVIGEIGATLERVAGRSPPEPPSAPIEVLAASEPPRELRAVAGVALDAAALLGARVAELHVALSARPEVEAFRPEPFTREDARALHDGVRDQIRTALALLRSQRRRLGAGVAARADAVLASEQALIERLAWLSSRPPGGLRTRTHGDLHLGQVLWTGRDFVLIDFEGEPARPLQARREKGSPLRDVAGMIRSFHYAAFHGIDVLAATQRTSTRLRDVIEAEAWAIGWYRWMAASFLGGYLDRAAAAPFLPAQPERASLLDVHLVEKALYELAYELNNRPAWVGLPLQGILELAAAPAAPPREEPEAPPAHAARRTPVAALAREARRRAPERLDEVVAKGGPGELDLHLWNEGTAYRAYRTLGAHLGAVDGVAGVSFAVWAPNAERVSVIGDFNGWDKERHVLRPAGGGIWQGFVPGVRKGATYKYHLRSRARGYRVDKADPFAFMAEAAPATQSIVWDLDYAWGDAEWMGARRGRNGLGSPMSIYEVHLGSWRRIPEQGNRPLTYREAAPLLADYAARMGFTHVELLPLMEHPFYGSWGYQTTGYFAPTSRYGTPQDFMALVDTLHQRGLGVILDWVPSHFPSDEHGLAYFDGTHLFEHEDRRRAHHPDWDSYIFDYARHEVRSFLLSSALFWLDRYHVDGLRLDAVASMLYLDYSRAPGEWIPNVHGGRENLDAVAFLRRLNEVVYAEHPDVQTFAEESTSWPAVSRPVHVGGLGFGLKWDMGWMHDTLSYMRQDPIFRKHHHHELTFRAMYAWSENFVLPLSHDEVVHGKGSLLDKMPGGDRERFANLRVLLGYMWAQPGKKLLFMGGEFGQGREWSHERSLDWHLLGVDRHAGVQRWVEDLNRLVRQEPALHARDFDPGGFEWIDCNDVESSVLSFVRRGGERDPEILAVVNFTPVARHSYRVGVPRGGRWREVLNSDAERYGGRGFGNLGGVDAVPVGAHGRLHSVVLTVPPLSVLFFRAEHA